MINGSRDEEWMRFQRALWDAINRYAVTCGGEPSNHVYGNVARMQAVSTVNDAVRGVLERDAADAAAYRALRAEAEASIAYSQSTSQKVARPPRMSPATVKIIMEARK